MITRILPHYQNENSPAYHNGSYIQMPLGHESLSIQPAVYTAQHKICGAKQNILKINCSSHAFTNSQSRVPNLKIARNDKICSKCSDHENIRGNLEFVKIGDDQFIFDISPLSNTILWIFAWVYPKISACCSLRNLG